MTRNTDFAYIGKVDFYGDMLFPANFLRAVNYNLVNQLDVYKRQAGLFKLCGNIAGFGSDQVVLCGNENEKDAFANNPEYQGKVKELVGWLNGNK